MRIPSSLIEAEIREEILLDEVAEFIALCTKNNQFVDTIICKTDHLVFKRSNGAATDVATTPVINEHTAWRWTPSLLPKFCFIKDLLWSYVANSPTAMKAPNQQRVK